MVLRRRKSGFYRLGRCWAIHYDPGMNTRSIVIILVLFLVAILGWFWWAGWEIQTNAEPGDAPATSSIGITKSAYAQVELGMSEGEVESILGARHSLIEERDGVAWRWSVDWSEDGYCEVVFKDGQVVEKEATGEGVTD